MKKRVLTSIAAVAVTLTMTTAFAASPVVMFGDNAQRTHANSIADAYPWAKEAALTSATDPKTGLTVSSLGSSSTAIGAGSVLFYPVSAGTASNNFQGQGYMIAYDTSHWVGGKPTVIGINQIPNVSNSSPVYDPNNNDAYLAAGTKFYRFSVAGGTLSSMAVSIGGTGTLNGGKNYNQVVSYPLYLTATQSGLSVDTVWISTQNGWLYAIDPNTMAVVYSHNFGVRFDASPALVTATNGTPYIAVTGAYDANNASFGGQSGTGTLFLIDPVTGLAQYAANPYPGVPSVASPVATSKGHVAWNDTEGDVLLGTINPGGTISILQQHASIGDSQTSDLSESGYANGQYIVPFTDRGMIGYATVDLTDGLVNQYKSAGTTGQLYPIGSPEISASLNMYLADQEGGIDQIGPDPSNGYLFDGTHGSWLPSFGTSGGTPLSTPSELNLGTDLGTVLPTLTLATNQGLELWVNQGEYLTFGSDYTSTSPTAFSTGLTLSIGANNLSKDAGNTDKIDFNINLNGGAFRNDVGSVSTYNAAGNPVTGAITIPTGTLDTWLTNYKTAHPTAWISTGMNNAVVEAYPQNGDTGNYVFQGSTAASDGSNAEVTVSFPAAPAALPTPPSALTAVSDPSSVLPGYTEWRFLSPGMFNVNEGVTYPSVDTATMHTVLGTAWKEHPIPEQAINSSPAATTSAYYTNQQNGGGVSDTQTANWWNNFTIEFNATTRPASFSVQGQVKTDGDMLYRKTYIGSWQPHWYWVSFWFGGGYWNWDGYTPVYNTEYLYRNVGVVETESASLSIPRGETYWWNPSTVNVSASGTFGNGDTPITPAGSGMSWTQPVWASYGGWIPGGSLEGVDYSQVPITTGLGNTNTHGLTPNSMLPGTWYSDAPMPAPPYGGDDSLQGYPTVHAFDAEHNGGVLFQPNVSNSDYPQLGSPQWWVQPTYTVTSGSGTFEHPQINTWVDTWAKPWGNNGGQGITSTSKSTVTWHS
nr:hypothetical protein [Bacilli bacterium]